MWCVPRFPRYVLLLRQGDGLNLTAQKAEILKNGSLYFQNFCTPAILVHGPFDWHISRSLTFKTPSDEPWSVEYLKGLSAFLQMS